MKYMSKITAVLLLFAPALLSGLEHDSTDEFYSGWQITGEPQIFTSQDLYGHINGGAELFLEFGFKKLSVSYYKSEESELALEVYQMDSHLSALGIYLMKCGKEKPVKDIQTRNTINRYQIMMIRDKYFIQINNFSGESAHIPVMIALAQQTIKPLQQNGEQNIFNQLPLENRVPGSELLVRGRYGLQKIYTFGPDDILGLSGKYFAVLADYDSPTTSKFTLLKIRYENDRHAQKIFLNLKSNLDPLLQIISESQDSFIFTDYKDDYGIIQVDGVFIEAKVNLKSLPDE